jgi:hypothetical protein
MTRVSHVWLVTYQAVGLDKVTRVLAVCSLMERAFEIAQTDHGSALTWVWSTAEIRSAWTGSGRYYVTRMEVE